MLSECDVTTFSIPKTDCSRESFVSLWCFSWHRKGIMATGLQAYIEDTNSRNQGDGSFTNTSGRDDLRFSSRVCAWFLQFACVLIIIFTMPLSICFCLKIVQEYERAVIFRLGRVLTASKGPGMFFIIPCLDDFVKADLRTVTFDVPPQEILTKDSVTVTVDAVVYWRISNPMISVTNVENASRSTQLLAQTTLRNCMGTKTLSEILSDRENISYQMQTVIDVGTDPWGVKVERVEIKDVRLPVQLQRAMATEAEAAREARAKVIAAEGEHKASRSLRDAAEVINESTSALQLRYLQTLTQISAEKNSTIIFPLPIDLPQLKIH